MAHAVHNQLTQRSRRTGTSKSFWPNAASMYRAVDQDGQVIDELVSDSAQATSPARDG